MDHSLDIQFAPLKKKLNLLLQAFHKKERSNVHFKSALNDLTHTVNEVYKELNQLDALGLERRLTEINALAENTKVAAEINKKAEATILAYLEEINFFTKQLKDVHTKNKTHNFFLSLLDS